MRYVFTGCSLTVGEGLDGEKFDKNNYCNLIADHFSAECINLAHKGNSNYRIFMAALNEILTNKADRVFVQWSGLSRHWLFPGPDTRLTVPLTDEDYFYKDIHLSKQQIRMFNDQFLILNHDYQNLLTIINYSNILASLGNVTFINGMIPWTDDIINFSHNMPLDTLSSYTKSMIDFDSRGDAEIYKFLTDLSESVSSLDQSLWVNMFAPLVKIKIDLGNDNAHPGIKSHIKFANTIIKHLEGRK